MKKYKLTELVSLRTLQKIQDNFSTAMAITLTVRDHQGDQITKPSSTSKLWHLLSKHPDHQASNKQQLHEAFHKSERTGQPIISERHPGTYTFVAPIHANGQVLAYFVGGLVRYTNPNLTTAPQHATSLKVNLDEYLDAFLSLPLFTPERLEAIANLVKIIGSTITSLEFEGVDNKIKKQQIQKENRLLSQNLKKTTHKLDQSIQRYINIFNNVNDGIYFASVDGRFIDLNDAGAKLLGYPSPTPLIGKETQSVYADPQDRKRFINAIKKKGYINNWIAHVKTSSGEDRYLETNASIVKNEQGRPEYIQGIFRDINSRMHRQII